jgi:MoxR-like ATPase
LSDALRRRCLFFWIPYPTLDEEIAILHARIPDLPARLASQIARSVQLLRTLPLQKAPGVAESLDWAQALVQLHRAHLDWKALEQTLGCVLKVREDQSVLESNHDALHNVLEEVLKPGGHSLDTDFGLGSVSSRR